MFASRNSCIIHFVGSAPRRQDEGASPQGEQVIRQPSVACLAGRITLGLLSRETLPRMAPTVTRPWPDLPLHDVMALVEVCLPEGGDRGSQVLAGLIAGNRDRYHAAIPATQRLLAVLADLQGKYRVEPARRRGRARTIRAWV